MMRCKKKVGTIAVKLAPMVIRRVLAVGIPDVAVTPNVVSGGGTDGGIAASISLSLAARQGVSDMMGLRSP